MPRVCTVCTHPQRAEIDRQLALGEATQSRISAQHGLVRRSLDRHARSHLSVDLIEAARAKVSDNGTDLSLVGRVTRMVDRLERLAENCTEYGAGKDLLAAARELRPYHELFGRANGQLATDKINALFVSLGVNGEPDLRQALDLTRRGKSSAPEEWLEDALAMLDFSLAQLPHKSQYALDRVKAATRKAGMLEPHLNGKESANGKEARPE